MGLIFATAAISGCASKSKTTDAAAGSSADASSTAGASDSSAKSSDNQSGLPVDLRSVRVFYFDFDSADIKEESQESLKAHAAHLVANPNVMAKLEGHADEKGTREYNLALGERRGDSVARFLKANGVAASQVEVVSYGEERPAEAGSDEVSWAKNRRVEISY